MSNYRKWKHWRILVAFGLVGLVAMVACGTAAETDLQPAAEPIAPQAASRQAAAPSAPSAAAQPAAPAAQQQAGSSAASSEPAAESAKQVAPTPTTVAQAALAPASESLAGPREAPSFASYWRPPTDFYGDPVYGGTLRINYEDPLEHANA